MLSSYFPILYALSKIIKCCLKYLLVKWRTSKVVASGLSRIDSLNTIDLRIHTVNPLLGAIYLYFAFGAAIGFALLHEDDTANRNSLGRVQWWSFEPDIQVRRERSRGASSTV